MSHKVKIEDEQINEANNSYSYNLKVFYDHDEDGEKELIWDDRITFSQWQVTDGRFEYRVQQFAENRISDFKQDVEDVSHEGKELEL